MNTNPWFVERMAQYERDRIQGDMRQIRLEEEALQASHIEGKTNKVNSPGDRRFLWIVSMFVRLRPLLRFSTRTTLGFRASIWPCHR